MLLSFELEKMSDRTSEPDRLSAVSLSGFRIGIGYMKSKAVVATEDVRVATDDALRALLRATDVVACDVAEDNGD